MKKKILLISNMYPCDEQPTYGVFVQNFEELMSKQNFSFTKSVIFGRGKNIFDKLAKYLNFFQSTISSIRTNQYDLIYVHYINHSLLPLLLIRNKTEKPLVINAHGSDTLPTSKTGKILQILVTPIIKKADLVVVPSAHFQTTIQNKFNIHQDKIFISPSTGINTELFQKLPHKDESIFTIGFVSRIDQGKGWDILIQAIDKLKKMDTPKRLQVFLIGGGDKEKELKTMISNHQLTDIVYIIGCVEHRKLPYWYNKMDLFIFPTTLNESLGLVGLEAMSCGVPVIGSNIGGLKEYIKNGVNGKLFTPGDADELSLKIFEFMQLSQIEKDQYSREAVKTAKNYDSKIVADHLSNKLLQILSKKGH